MAPKTQSLAAALNAANKKPALVPPAPKPQEPTPAPAAKVRPSRVGKKPVTGFFDRAVSRQLKQMALDNDENTIQELMREALNDLFVKHGKKPIA